MMHEPAPWNSPQAAPREDRRRATAPTVACAMCGIQLPVHQMVADGGQACADVRWYCKDAQSCTERWTASLPRHAHIAPTPVSLAPPPAPMPMAITASDPVPAELLSAPEEAWSIDPS
jgi:hypothetical protein